MTIKELIKEEGGEIAFDVEQYPCVWESRRLVILDGNIYEQYEDMDGAWQTVTTLRGQAADAILAAHEEAITKKYQPLVDAAEAVSTAKDHELLDAVSSLITALSTLDKEGEE